MGWKLGRERLSKVRLLNGVDPLRLAVEGIPDAPDKLGSMGIAVAASKLPNGRDGFVVFAWFDETNAPGHPFAVEELLDPSCSNYKR